MLDCIGMKRFTSANRTPTTTNVMTSCMSGISCSPFAFVETDQAWSALFKAFSLLFCAHFGNRPCMSRIGNRLHEIEGRFRSLDVT
jgi:hypothetical protein